MIFEIHLGALKVGGRSSSLSRTIQINRKRSRPGADMGLNWLPVRSKVDFDHFKVDFWMVIGNILEGFSMSFWIFFTIFHICLETFH